MARETMNAWVYDNTGKDPDGVYIYRREVPMPRPAPGYVLLKVLGVSVCGTDEHLFRGDHPEVAPGTIPGHEYYGEVVELGKGAKGVKVGDRIAGESHYVVDGHVGDGVIGYMGPRTQEGKRIAAIAGAYAEYLTVPDYCCNTLPAGPLHTEFWPSLIEGMGNDYYIVHWIKQAGRLKGTIGVIGAGPHGLCSQLFAKELADEPVRIVSLEVSSYRRGFSRGFGVADFTVNSLDPHIKAIVAELTDGKGFDVVIDGAGVRREVLEFALDNTREGGCTVLFALYDDPTILVDGRKPNELIFDKIETAITHKGKRITVKGVTGREGIWRPLIELVHESSEIRRKVMSIVTVKGALEQLRDDTIHANPEVMKRAYRPFGG
ncbi:MAG: alcohol dehydrogenase catalytic domain-containing protein [Verrucomicrobia bacterium]|nr:alcohol dehydrogenase catalytic domain-containing protein [Verrucomicrobiota bacterium]